MTARAAIASLCIAIAAPALPAAGQGIPDVEAGVSLFWVSHYDGYDSSYRERIVAADDDWAIYQLFVDDELSEGDDVGPDDFYALFYGIDYRDCAEDEMPDEAERGRLAALFPLTEGSVMEDTTFGGSPVIRVGAQEGFFLMGETVSANKVVFDYPDDQEEYVDEAVYVLSDKPYTVAMDWDEGGKDRVMLIAQSDETQEAPSPDMLGNCAALLN